jgi:hypothetical protein
VPAGNGLTDDQMAMLIAQSTNPYARNMEPQQVATAMSNASRNNDALELEIESMRNQRQLEPASNQSWSGNEYDDRSQAELDTQARYNQLAKSMPAQDKYAYLADSLGDAGRIHGENMMDRERQAVIDSTPEADRAGFQAYLASLANK